MPLLEDLTVYEDGDRYDVYDHSYPDEDAELGRGRLLGEGKGQGGPQQRSTAEQPQLGLRPGECD